MYVCVCGCLCIGSHTDMISSLTTDLGSKYQPIVIEDDGDSEIDSEDAALSALLHERVVKVKQEIDWDLEEQKLREKKREKELKLKEQSSSDDESDSAVYPEVRWRRRNGRGKWAWPVPGSISSIGMRSDPKNHVQGGGPKQIMMIDPSSQFVTTVSVQPGLESEDPNDQDDTIVYSQHDNSVALYPGQSLSQSLLDTTGTCTTELNNSEGTDSVSDVPFDVPVRNHHLFQNSRPMLHPPGSLNGVILAGSHIHTCDSNHRCRKESEFLSSVNSEVEADQSSTASVYKPTLDVHICESTRTLPDNTTVNSQSCGSGPSNRQQHLPTRVEPFNITKIDSQSSTEEEILSGTASEVEGSQRFSTRQPISQNQSSAVVSEARQDENAEATSQSESESELETLPRPSRIRLGDDETGEELLLSGYESGYVETRTQSNTRVRTIASPRSSSSTPPPANDVMTPPSSPERRESATSTLSAVKLKPLQLSLTPVCISPRRESVSEQLTTGIDPPLPPACTPLTEALVVEVGVPEKDVSKEVSSGVVQGSVDASLNPNPAVNSSTPSDTMTRHIPQQQLSTHLVPSTEPSPSNDSSLTETSEMAQNNLSRTEDAITNCTCCPWQSTGSVVCAHYPPSCSLCLSCSCHACTYDQHCLQVMSLKRPQNSGNTSPPPEENHTHSSFCCSSHIQNTNTTLTPCTTDDSYGDSAPTLPTCSSNISEVKPCSPPPAVELDYGRNHTHFASSCCTHGSNANCCSSPSHTHSCSPYTQPSTSSAQEESHTHPMSPCSGSSHTLTAPSSCTNHSNHTNHCTCCSTVRSPPHCNNALSSRLFAMPSPQLMLPLNLKRSRDNEELSSNSSGGEISSPPAKRYCQ